MSRKWIKPRKRGTFQKSLGIPADKTVPLTLLKKIYNAKIGSTIMNPTKSGYKKIKITKLMKQRSALTLLIKSKPSYKDEYGYKEDER